jgi:polyisoprenoid-binding protein YceI
MKKLLSICSALALLSISASARDTLYGSVTSEFKVKATVDSFTGKTASEPFVVQPTDEKVAVTFEIAKMETGKKKRDTEMMHMFHADEFPVITGTASAADVLSLASASEPIDLPIEVVMHGVTKQVVAKATKVNQADGGIAFDMEFPLILSDYDLKAPSIMMMIKVNNEVLVSSHVTLSAKAP